MRKRERGALRFCYVSYLGLDLAAESLTAISIQSLRSISNTKADAPNLGGKLKDETNLGCWIKVKS